MVKKLEHIGEWVLLQIKNHELLAHNPDFMKIHEESLKYPVDKVIIEQRLKHGTCFF